ncbi:MAG: Oxygen-dependent choline dehydrogenase [Alphaproteobacteria bacterium MarineAlpha4_Bin2]|nr:MAG: Oxygen-dependent choline dehydrogenase [Alphaproteobacteria bacterium MarineAlpha4_Bin2]
MVDESFDYIIVGAGSAGSVLANRLSADGKYTVLVLEAGKEGHPWSRIPVGFAKLIENPAANWLYESEPEEASGGRRIPVPRGKLLGGSSSINGMVFVRGQAQDYDTWAQLGNRGWSYRDVLPIFKEMESYDGEGDDEFRGRDGPLKVNESIESGEIYDKLIAAASEVGIEYTKDYNGHQQDGIGMTQATIRGGRRMSTAYCYLDPARDRPNLKIQANALTEGLTFEGKRCTGVRYRIDGQACEAAANREVILSAGSINSPQLLELSGIGQAERLKELGIEVRHELKGVGENLRDHYSPRMKWSVPRELGLTYNDKGRGLGLVWQALKYALTDKGLLGIPASPIRAYVRTREGLEAPDAAISWMPFLANENFQLHKDSGITAITHVLRSDSTGSIHVTSSDPDKAPAIRFNFLSAQSDRDILLESIRITRRIMNAGPMKEVARDEMAPGVNLQSDDDLLEWVKHNAETTYHPVGTCKMGNDPMAVVDDQLKVHQIEGLRVADASIMPTLTSGNTNAPSIMIGEKASRMVLSAA